VIRRRIIPRPQNLDSATLSVLSPQRRTKSRLPRQIHHGSEARISPRRALPSCDLRTLGDEKEFRSFLRALHRPSLGGLLEATVLEARNTAELPGTLHAPRRHFQSPAGKSRGWEVTFRWKDYAHGGQQKLMTLTADEFLRRFLLHIVPRGFVRIRSFVSWQTADEKRCCQSANNCSAQNPKRLRRRILPCQENNPLGYVLTVGGRWS